MTALLVNARTCVLVLMLAAYGMARAQRSKGRNIPVGGDVKASVNFDCPEEFGYYPHPTDCTQYYVCVFGGALLESCTGGLMYSHELQTCDWPRNVGCDALGPVSVTSSGGGVSASVQTVSRVPEQRVRYTVASPTSPPPSQPAAVVTSRGQSRQLHHTQEIISKQKQQQQLYADADDVLPPAEEIENDRQQRVYRGQPSTVGQVQRDRDGLRHTNAIPTSSRGEKISVISFGTQQQQPIQYRNNTLYNDDSLTNFLTEKRRRKRQVRRRLPAIDLLNSNGDAGILWQNRHTPQIIYQPNKQTHQNHRQIATSLQSPPTQRTHLQFKPSYQQTGFNPAKPLKPSGDQTEFQPFSPNPLLYKTPQLLKIYPYNTHSLVKQQPVNYQYYDYNTNKPDIRIQTPQNLTENYAYFNLGGVATTPRVLGQVPPTQAKPVQMHYKPSVQPAKYYPEENPGIHPPPTVQYDNRLNNQKPSIRKPTSYKTQATTQRPSLQTTERKPETYYNNPTQQSKTKSKPDTSTEKESPKSSEEDRENAQDTSEENEESDEDDEEEEEEETEDEEDEEESSDEENKKGKQDSSIKPDFPTPPPFFFKSTNKYENVDNPFADPNFDFDKFISKLKGPEIVPKQVTTGAKYQKIAAQNDSREKHIHSKLKPEDLDLRTPVAFSSPDERNNKRPPAKPHADHESEEYYYDDSEEEEIPEKVRKPFVKVKNDEYDSKNSDKKTQSQNKRKNASAENSSSHRTPTLNEQKKSSHRKHERPTSVTSSNKDYNNEHKNVRYREYDDKQNKNIKPNEEYEYYDYYDYPDSEEKHTSEKNRNRDEGIVALLNRPKMTNANLKHGYFREGPTILKDLSKLLPVDQETGLIRPLTYEEILNDNKSYMMTYQKPIKNKQNEENNEPSRNSYQRPILTSTARPTQPTTWLTTAKSNRAKIHNKLSTRLMTTTFRPYRDLDITEPQKTSSRNSSKLEETNVSPQSHSISSVQSTTASRTLYNGSQHYDPSQYDPYYPIYEDDVELYRDVDYTQQYTSNRAQPPSTQHTYRGTPAPISIPVQSTVQEEPTPQRGSTYIQSGYSTQAQDIYSRPSAQDYHDDNYNTQVDEQTSYRQSSRQPSRGDRNELSYFVETSPKSTTTIRTTTTTTTTTTTPRPIPVQKQTAVPSRLPIIATANQTRPQSIIITLSATPGQNHPKTRESNTDPETDTINKNSTSNKKEHSRFISLRTDFSPRHNDEKPTRQTTLDETQTGTPLLTLNENIRPAPFSLAKLPTAEMKSVVFQLSSRLSSLTPNASDESESYTLSRTRSNKKRTEIENTDHTSSASVLADDNDTYFTPTTYAPKLLSLASVLTPLYLNTQSITTPTTLEHSKSHQEESTTQKQSTPNTTTDKSVRSIIRKLPTQPEPTTPTYSRRNRTDRKIISKIHFGLPQIIDNNPDSTTASLRIRTKETNRHLESQISTTELIKHSELEKTENVQAASFRGRKRLTNVFLDNPASISSSSSTESAKHFDYRTTRTTTERMSAINGDYFIPTSEELTSTHSYDRSFPVSTPYSGRSNRMILPPQPSINLYYERYKPTTSSEKLNVIPYTPTVRTTTEYVQQSSTSENPSTSRYILKTPPSTSTVRPNFSSTTPNTVTYSSTNRFAPATDTIENIFPQFKFSAKYPYSSIERSNRNRTVGNDDKEISTNKQQPTTSEKYSTTTGTTTTSTTTEFVRQYKYKASTTESTTTESTSTAHSTYLNKKQYSTSDVTSSTTLVPQRATEKYKYVQNAEDESLDSERIRSQLLENRTAKPFRATAELPSVPEILATQNEQSKKETDLPPTYKPKPIQMPSALDLTNKTTPADQSRSFSLPARVSRVNTAIKSLIAFGATRRNTQSPKCNENQTRPDTKCNEIQKQRTSSRGRGSAHYTNAGVSETVTANRGTPATRFRPTLKPSTSIVSKASEYVDIYKYPPHRPDPIYPQPQVDKTAAKCRKDVCLLPDCSCGGKEIPGDLPVEQVPQVVLLTFDDSVNDLNKGLYVDLFEKGRTNPNGCPIAATFYVSHEWTDYSQVQNLYSDGHEIASHTVSHSFGEQFSQKKWNREVAGQREILAAYGGVHLEDVRGMRAPFLSVGGNKMFKMLYDSNFTYDSSLPVYENRPPSWPYTLDYKLFHDCMIPPCPTRSYPGVWEVPMVMWQDLNGGRCSMGDACSNPPDSDGVYKMLMKNFERHYTTNRAPFGLFYHAAWFTQPHHKEGFIRFLDFLVSKDDVYMVTNWQAIQWVRDPTPLNRIKSFQPFQCNYPERPKRCNNPKVCNLWHKSGVRYMKTCQPCPDIYPWTGKTGIRSSRIDNDIED